MKQTIPLLLAAACLQGLSPFACAQVAYPDKPIRIIVPFGAGGFGRSW